MALWAGNNTALINHLEEADKAARRAAAIERRLSVEREKSNSNLNLNNRGLNN